MSSIGRPVRKRTSTGDIPPNTKGHGERASRRFSTPPRVSAPRNGLSERYKYNSEPAKPVLRATATLRVAPGPCGWGGPQIRWPMASHREILQRAEMTVAARVQESGDGKALTCGPAAIRVDDWRNVIGKLKAASQCVKAFKLLSVAIGNRQHHRLDGFKITRRSLPESVLGCNPDGAGVCPTGAAPRHVPIVPPLAFDAAACPVPGFTSAAGTCSRAHDGTHVLD